MNQPLFLLIIVVGILFLLFDEFAPTGKKRISALIVRMQPTLLGGGQY